MMMPPSNNTAETAYDTTQTLIHWPLGDVEVIFKALFPNMLKINTMSTSCEIAFKWMPQNTFDDNINIGPGSGLVPSGNT